jgi:hypothetical protein
VFGDPDPTKDNADDPLVVSAFMAQHCATISELGNVLNNIPREWLAPGFWKFTVNYKSPTGDRQTNDASFSFTTGGGTQHITHSRQTVASYPQADPNDDNSTAPPSFQGGINVTDSSVEGADIHVPSFDFKTCYYIAPANMTQGYIASLKALTGRVNSDNVQLNVDGVVISFQPGELLLLGADGAKRKGFGDWELTLNWSNSANATNLSVGQITGVVKNGWDYLWVLSEPTISNGALVMNPTAVYIERVYDYQPLTPLVRSTSFGLGNTQFWQTPSAVTGGGLT